MSDTENTTTTAETTESPKTGIAAAEAILEAHWAKKDAPVSEETDDQEDEPQEPAKPQKKKAGLVKALREERAARKQAAAQLAQLQAQLDELKKGATAAPSGIDRERLKKEPLQVLLEAEADESALLDALQKRAIEQGGLSPAAQKMFDKLAKDNAELREKIAKFEEGMAAKTDEQENAAGWAALQHEAAKVDAYPELKGWEWHELEAPIEQAIQFYAAKGHERVSPEEILGTVNMAFKAQREASLKRWGVAPPAAEPPKKAAPPAKASKKAPVDDGDELPPVEPTGSRRKARLPTDAEIQRRVSRQLSHSRLSCCLPGTLCQVSPPANGDRSVGRTLPRPARTSPATSTLDTQVHPCPLAPKTSPQQRTA